MLLLTIVLGLVAVLTAMRVRQLWAAPLWIALHGPAWQACIDALPEGPTQDPVSVWQCYAANGGNQWGFWPLGNKGYRARAWVARNRSGHRWRAHGVRLVLGLWSWYVFSPLLAIMVLAFAFAPRDMPRVAVGFLVAVAVMAVVGQISIAVEGYVAKVVLRSWALGYHRIRYPADYPQLGRLLEHAIVWVCVALAWLSGFALVVVLATRLSAYGAVPETTGWPQALESATGLTTTGLVSNAWAVASGHAGFAGNVLLFLLYAAFFLALVVKADSGDGPSVPDRSTVHTHRQSATARRRRRQDVDTERSCRRVPD